ncbi:MAG: single-stranded DNA-binding protein [Chloroflexota bacterium]|nr:single-stranded DNA-binding protein [Chloroflexota bacterium]
MAGRGLNKVQIIGNLGKDPEMKYLPSGKATTTFSVAVGRTSRTAEGQAEEQTEWFRVVTWEKLAETCNQFLHKGSKVYIEGRLQTRTWKDKDGQEQKIVEVIAQEMQMLDSRPEGSNGSNGSAGATGPTRTWENGRSRVTVPAGPDDDDDAIPF